MPLSSKELKEMLLKNNLSLKELKLLWIAVFEITSEAIVLSKKSIEKEINKIEKHLSEENASNVYFRKVLNYKTGNDIYIIRPNEVRYWNKSIAEIDADILILEILNNK